MKDKTVASIAFVKAEEAPLPTFKESRFGEYVRFGDDDKYPNYLLLLLNKSAKHNAIIRNKLKYIYGNGFLSKSNNADLNRWLKKCNRTDEGMNDVSKKSIKDVEVFGGFYWNIIPNSLGGIAEIYHLDFKNVRTNSTRTKFFYKKDWSDRAETMQEFDPYKKGIRTSCIFSYREDNQDHCYCLPGYIPALNWIESDYEVSKHTLNNAKNGFKGSKVLHTFDGIPANNEDKKKIVKALKNEYTGSEGSSLLVTFNTPNAQNVVRVEDLGVSDLTKEDFSAVDNLITSNIYAGHEITSPSLFGIKEAGQLGGSSELKNAFEIFKNTYANFKQKQIEDVVNYFAQIIYNVSDLKLQDVSPIGTEKLNPNDFKEILPIGWVYENLGIDAVKYPVNNAAAGSTAPTNPASGSQPVASEQMVNENVKNLTAKQHQQLLRIVRQFTKQQLTEKQATVLLKTSLGLSDTEIKDILGLDQSEQEFDKEYTEQEAADMFEEIGSSKEGFQFIKSKEATFAEDEFEANEMFAAVQETTLLETQVLAILKQDKKATAETIASALGVEKSAVESTIKTLSEKGIVKLQPGGKLINDIISKKGTAPKVFIKYSYEVKPGIGAEIIPTTRPFCKKLITLNRLYSRSEIQQLSMRLGYSVWDRRGGFWGKKAECRHFWKAHIVIEREAKK